MAAVFCAVSRRSKLAESVLNDQYISTTSGSEDFSFKASRKNNYEDILFRCEDERYDVRYSISTATAAWDALTDLLRGVGLFSWTWRSS